MGDRDNGQPRAMATMGGSWAKATMIMGNLWAVKTVGAVCADKAQWTLIAAVRKPAMARRGRATPRNADEIHRMSRHTELRRRTSRWQSGVVDSLAHAGEMSGSRCETQVQFSQLLSSKRVKWHFEAEDHLGGSNGEPSQWIVKPKDLALASLVPWIY